MKKGHYHIELDSGVCINESILSVTIAKAMARGTKPVECGYICVYGCGQLHPLTDEELAMLSDVELSYVQTVAE